MNFRVKVENLQRHKSTNEFTAPSAVIKPISHSILNRKLQVFYFKNFDGQRKSKRKKIKFRKEHKPHSKFSIHNLFNCICTIFKKKLNISFFMLTILHLFNMPQVQIIGVSPSLGLVSKNKQDKKK